MKGSHLKILPKNTNMKMFNLTMKQNLLRHDVKVYCFKCTTAKFEQPSEQNVDPASVQSLANLPSKVELESRGQNVT